MNQSIHRLVGRHPAQILVVVCLVLEFALPVLPAHAVDHEDDARSAQMRRGRRRVRRPRRPPPPAPAPVEAESTDDEDGGDEETPPTAEANASDVTAAAATGEGDDDGATTTGNLRRSNRMEFDARLVRGETAGAGAVVLFNRGNRPLLPLTQERRGFSRQTVRDVVGTVDETRENDTPRRPQRRGRRRAGPG